MTVTDLHALEEVQAELHQAFETLGDLSCREPVSLEAKARLDATIDRQVGEIHRLQGLEARLRRGEPWP